MACDMAEGRLPVPGGIVHETPCWIVDHCVGPLGVGTLIVKPRRHVVRVSELDGDEASELGPLLQAAAAAADDLLRPEQVYVTLWSHAGRARQHIHWVVQPVDDALMDAHGGLFGPRLQVEMFDRAAAPPRDEVEAICRRYRAWFADAGLIARSAG